jgi:energy-coupling factor transporter ATP-binding protein EcfA2
MFGGGLSFPTTFIAGFVNIEESNGSTNSINSTIENLLYSCCQIDPPDVKEEKEEPTIDEEFQLPMMYLDTSTVFPLSPVVAEDLELNTAIYHHLLQPSHSFATEMIPEWNKYYTTNIPFLEDTQKILESMESYKEGTHGKSHYTVNCEKITDIWKDTKTNPSFLEKYSYVEWNMLKELNKSSSFLQIQTFANLLSPAMSLLIPFIFFIFPFILLKLQGIPITFEVYIDTLKEIAKHHMIGRTIDTIQSISWEKLIYFIMTMGLYMMQIYQNVNMCIRLYRNIHSMNDSLMELQQYLQYSIRSMDTFVGLHKDKPTYRAFCSCVEKNQRILQELYNQIEPITPFSHSISKLNDIGYMLQCYYEIHSNTEYGASLQYSMKFEGYINNILGVYDNLAACSVSFATFDTDADVVMKEQYYPPYKHDKYITNTCKFNKNMVITGPNAAGKTTLLKSTCINIIMTQQFGCGYYSSCCINPYTHIHSYLNIPDTSGRDSLFQAETRRCKEILDIIQDNQGAENRHFCIFDELYSGTNPVEATKAAYSFLLYLTKYTNVNFMLTTHYISICKKIKKNKESRIRNYKMDIVFDKEGKIKYTYKMIRGISNVQGAVRILEEFAYPDEIIQNVLNYKNL